MSLMRRDNHAKRSDRAANRVKKNLRAQHAQNVTPPISVEEIRGDRRAKTFSPVEGTVRRPRS
jgi:hypothetical protein